MFGRQARLALLSAAALALVAGCAHKAEIPQDQIAADAANAAFRQNRYQDAVDNYMKAIALAESSNPAAVEKHKIHLAAVYREQAMRCAYANKEATSAEDLDQAIKYCGLAEALDPAGAARYEDMIAKFQAKISLLKYRAVAADERLIPDGKTLGEKNAIYMAQAQAYILAGDYLEARKHYQKILSYDPSNAEALRDLSKINAKIAATSAPAVSSTNSVRVVEVAVVKARPTTVPLPSPTFAPTAGPKQLPAPDPQTSQLLRSTVVAKLSLKHVSVREAFDTISRTSAASWNGVVKFSFVGMDPDSKDLPLIDFSADNISLDDAVNSICVATNLAYSPGAEGEVAVFKKP